MAQADRNVTARNTVISASEARALFEKGAVRFIDARWYMPNDGRNSREEFTRAHLPDAAFLDIDKLATPSDNHPHLMPAIDTLARWLKEKGISGDEMLVVYDDNGFFSAPRGWWLLASFGLPSVRVLEGGLNGWRAAGGAIETGEEASHPAETEAASLRASPLANRAEVRSALANKTYRVIDARPAGRFEGTDPEPRPGLSSGHMPGAINIPFPQVLDENGQLLPDEQLSRVLAQKGLSGQENVIASCGSGITACILLQALAEAGWQGEMKLYDGSWIDWASQPDAEIVKAC